mmetsp:Transcript_17497/g.41164  ORF Transcript_17497/g.41164 Transcript_17497/m.41164 type:complete len:234 (+) Transcript_17497:1206-1907(+)
MSPEGDGPSAPSGCASSSSSPAPSSGSCSGSGESVMAVNSSRGRSPAREATSSSKASVTLTPQSLPKLECSHASHPLTTWAPSKVTVRPMSSGSSLSWTCSFPQMLASTESESQSGLLLPSAPSSAATSSGDKVCLCLERRYDKALPRSCSGGTANVVGSGVRALRPERCGPSLQPTAMTTWGGSDAGSHRKGSESSGKTSNESTITARQPPSSAARHPAYSSRPNTARHAAV